MEQNERNMVALHRAQEAQVSRFDLRPSIIVRAFQVQLSDRNFWTTVESITADANDRVNDRRAIIEGAPTANALRDLSKADEAERADMWRRHWDQHMEESQYRLDQLHQAQDSIGHIADHAVSHRHHDP